MSDVATIVAAISASIPPTIMALAAYRRLSTGNGKSIGKAVASLDAKVDRLHEWTVEHATGHALKRRRPT